MGSGAASCTFWASGIDYSPSRGVRPNFVQNLVECIDSAPTTRLSALPSREDANDFVLVTYELGRRQKLLLLPQRSDVQSHQRVQGHRADQRGVKIGSRSLSLPPTSTLRSRPGPAGANGRLLNLMQPRHEKSAKSNCAPVLILIP
jgi:hypothetical protein